MEKKVIYMLFKATKESGHGEHEGKWVVAEYTQGWWESIDVVDGSYEIKGSFEHIEDALNLMSYLAGS